MSPRICPTCRHPEPDRRHLPPLPDARWDRCGSCGDPVWIGFTPAELEAGALHDVVDALADAMPTEET